MNGIKEHNASQTKMFEERANKANQMIVMAVSIDDKGNARFMCVNEISMNEAIATLRSLADQI